jgi:hypothetical protein
MAIRVLILLSAGLLLVSVLEARAVRGLRAELQRVTGERDRARAETAAVWGRGAAAEFLEAVRHLDAFHADPTDGLGRAGGLCAAGTLDHQALATYVAGSFLASRVEGRSLEQSIEIMKEAARRAGAAGR